MLPPLYPPLLLILPPPPTEVRSVSSIAPGGVKLQDLVPQPLLLVVRAPPQPEPDPDAEAPTAAQPKGVSNGGTHVPASAPYSPR